MINKTRISGGKEENFDFTMGPNTSAYQSCSAQLNGEMYVFGGDDGYYKQVVLIQTNDNDSKKS